MTHYFGYFPLGILERKLFLNHSYHKAPTGAPQSLHNSRCEKNDQKLLWMWSGLFQVWEHDFALFKTFSFRGNHGNTATFQKAGSNFRKNLSKFLSQADLFKEM